MNINLKELAAKTGKSEVEIAKLLISAIIRKRRLPNELR